MPDMTATSFSPSHTLYYRIEYLCGPVYVLVMIVVWALRVWAPNMLPDSSFLICPPWIYAVGVAIMVVHSWGIRVAISQISISDSRLCSRLGSPSTVIDLLKPYTIYYRQHGQRLTHLGWPFWRPPLAEIEVLQAGSSIRLMPIQLVRDGVFDSLPSDVKLASNRLLPTKYQFREA